MLVIVWAARSSSSRWSTPRFARRGGACCAIREDEDAASALGKNVFAYKLQALTLGAALAAVAGLFFAFQFSFFSPGDFDPLLTFFAYTIGLAGTARNGRSSRRRPLRRDLRGDALRLFVHPVRLGRRAYLRLVVIGLILIALMLFRPQGLFGGREEMVLE